MDVPCDFTAVFPTPEAGTSFGANCDEGVCVNIHSEQQMTVTAREVGGGARKLLIVEDDDLTRKFLMAFFGTKGYQVSVAATAEEALRIAGEISPGLVLTDFQLPGMDGIGMVRSLRNAGHRVPFILISGFLSADIEAEAQEAGVAVILRKPLELAVLHDSVQSLFPVAVSPQ